MAVLVADREDDAGAELVVDTRAALTRRGEADLDELLGTHVALGAELGDERVPATRRPTELMGRDRLVGEATPTEIVACDLAGLRAGQDRVVEGDRMVEDLAETRLVRVLALGPLIDLHAGPGGQLAERLRERQAVALHHEAEDVATEPAPEALPALAHGGNDERGSLLAVEGAQPLERRPRLLQRHRLADDVDDRELALDFGCNADCQTPTSGPAPPLRRGLTPMPNMTEGLSSLDRPRRRKCTPRKPDLSSPCQYPMGVSGGLGAP